MGSEPGIESNPDARLPRPGGMTTTYSPAIYQQLFEWMPGSVLLLDGNAVVLDVNPAFCRQIGYTREELRGQHVSFFSQDSRDAIDRNLARLFAGETLEHDVTNIQKDGSLRHYELRETAITLPDGSRGILALSNDITWRVTAEQEKLELQRQFLHAEKLKSLGLMAGGIAHDFNNLLMIIIGNIELGMSEPGGNPASDPMFREAINAANRAAHLTRQMLAYSGRAYFDITQVNLNEVVRRTAELLHITISKRATLELRLSPDLPLVEGDAAQLQQILLNLVTNSAEALDGKPGLITITTFVREYDVAGLALSRADIDLMPGRYAVLEVSDTGSGMDESVQHRLFDPFFTTKFAGRGLGMSAVLGAVRGHHGGILVSSQPGQGTTISLLLPPVTART
jgi:PAS domain S-box-containing protein